MPELLLLARDSKSSFVLEERAAAAGFRVKTTFENSIAKEWARLREFDAALIHDEVNIVTQQEISNDLWKRNLLAPMVLFNLDSSGAVTVPQARIAGAELAAGEHALEIIDKILASVKPRGSATSEKFKVLVVEDLDAPRDIICTYLESLGFRSVCGVSSATEALALLSSDPSQISCIVTDIRMPQMSGQEFITQLRLHPKTKHIPAIVLTAHGTLDCLMECLKAGASGFLVKPPKKADLTREMARAFRISVNGSDPRLASAQEADELMEILLERGIGE